ncbi:hypothetical protein [Actinoplanes derwentensis]|uniref:Uncharacterized protein n=1 Tax=Actinoplanes derwentensis TaxID=113562 RepID=A0A1H2A1G6_9ACTN|nr:hypothetical protein [Actinoplanes derwentensis]GID83427.1 hypothetical protein Ade03nite_23510 [Actinoplanes derwentensis]SDT39774.1 hypothetical protein SAMN04489716_3613 [Actinoplanes derwentensis]
MHLTHVPTRGHYAHIASSACTDTVVLAEYNGRPTLLMLEIDDMPVLAWMLQGADDSQQLWVYVPLTAAELDDFYRDRPDALADWLRPRHGRDAYVAIAQDGVLLLANAWRLPDVSAKQFTNHAARAALDEIRRTLSVPELPRRFDEELRTIKTEPLELAEAC